MKTISSYLEKAVNAFSDLMSKPISFIAVVIITALALIFQLDSTILNVSISVFTMIVGLAVLVSTKRGEIALHLKLDKIIEAADMTNEVIGAEHEDTEKLLEDKKKVEAVNVVVAEQNP